MTTASFNPTIDSYMNFSFPDTNYGAAGIVAMRIIWIGGQKLEWSRAILDFDVSALVATGYVSLDAAELQLRATGYTAMASKIFRVVRTWTEGGVTWNDYNAGAWTGGGADNSPNDRHATVPTPVAFTSGAGSPKVIAGMLGFVTDAIANRSNKVSLLMFMDDETSQGPDAFQGFDFNSRSQANPAKLVITYTPLPGVAAARRHRGQVAG